MKETIFLNLKIDPCEINFLNCILEAYEGWANLRTVNAKEGLVQIWIMPDFLGQTLLVITNIAQSIGLIKMEWGETMHAG